MVQILPTFLAIEAALSHGTAYWLYNRQAKSGDSTPNAVSWFIWVFLSTLNAFSYKSLSGDFVPALQFFTGSIACILTFIHVSLIGKFQIPKKDDKVAWSVLGLCTIASLIWYINQEAYWASIVISIAFIVSFEPTYRGLLSGKGHETPRSWVLWTIAFAATITNRVICGKTSIFDLAMPLTGLICHGGVALLCCSKFTNNKSNRSEIDISKIEEMFS